MTRILCFLVVVLVAVSASDTMAGPADDVLARIPEQIASLTAEQTRLLGRVRQDVNSAVERLPQYRQIHDELSRIMHLPCDYHRLLKNQYGFLDAFLGFQGSQKLPFGALDVLGFFALHPKETQTVYRKAFDIIDYSWMVGRLAELTSETRRAYRLRDAFLRLALNDSIIANLRSYESRVRAGLITPHETYMPDANLDQDLGAFMGKPDAKLLATILQWFYKRFDKPRGDAVKLSYELMAPRPSYYMEEQTSSNQNRVIFVRRFLECLATAEYRDWIARLQQTLDDIAARLEAMPGPAGLLPGESPLLRANLFDLTRSLTQDDAKAITVLGALCSQRESLYYGLRSFLMEKGVFHSSFATLKSVSIIHFQVFRINQLYQELIGRSPTYKHAFSYPKGYRSADAAYYHFWAAAFIAMELQKRGVSAQDNLWAAKNIGLAYEVATFPIAAAMRLFGGSSLFTAIGTNIRSSRDDVQLHERGALFATDLLAR